MESVIMQMHPFYLFLRYASLEMQDQRYGEPRQIVEQDWIRGAMQNMNSSQKKEIASFIDLALSTNNDHKALARVFDDGNSYRIWHSDEGPRQLLLAIRAAALAAA